MRDPILFLRDELLSTEGKKECDGNPTVGRKYHHILYLRQEPKTNEWHQQQGKGLVKVNGMPLNLVTPEILRFKVHLAYNLHQKHQLI